MNPPNGGKVAEMKQMTDEELAEAYLDSGEFRRENRVWARPSHVKVFLAGMKAEKARNNRLREELRFSQSVARDRCITIDRIESELVLEKAKSAKLVEALEEIRKPCEPTQDCTCKSWDQCVEIAYEALKEYRGENT